MFLHFTQPGSTSWLEISLFEIAHFLFIVAEHEINKPEVQRIFEVNSDQEKEEAIDYAVRVVLRELFWALPMLILQTSNRAIYDSIISYIKTDVEHMSRLTGKKLELPGNFEFLPHEVLNSLNSPTQPLEDWRQLLRSKNFSRCFLPALCLSGNFLVWWLLLFLFSCCLANLLADTPAIAAIVAFIGFIYLIVRIRANCETATRGAKAARGNLEDKINGSTRRYGGRIFSYHFSRGKSDCCS